MTIDKNVIAWLKSGITQSCHENGNIENTFKDSIIIEPNEYYHWYTPICHNLKIFSNSVQTGTSPLILVYTAERVDW